METIRLRTSHLWFLLVIVAITMAIMEYGGPQEEKGTFLLTIVFWAGILQGAIAVVAVTDLIEARWIDALREKLLSLYPLLYFLLILFLIFIPRAGVFPWTAHPGAWLNETFFIIRNILLLLAACLAARFFARAALRRDSGTKRWAVIYLFIFVASQSLVAFDWVMSLEYPWISTLFGAFFFVEALYGGLAMAGILFFSEPRPDASFPVKAAPRDIGLLLFGFSVLWGGLFFAQFLLIWYGHLPEEISFISERINSPLYRALGYAFLAFNFFIPFLVMISRKAKGQAGVVAAVSGVILTGIFIERIFYIGPALSLNEGAAFFQTVLMFTAVLAFVNNRNEFLSRLAGKDAA